MNDDRNPQFVALVGSVFDALLKTLHEYGKADSCIDAASLLMKVMHGRSWPDAYRLAVGVEIVNPAGSEFFKSGKTAIGERAMVEFNEAGGGIVILGRRALEIEEIDESRWPGHLVVIVPRAFGERHALLDPTISQVNNPGWGINLPPITLRVDDAFVSAQRKVKYDVLGSNVTYEAFPEDRSYLQPIDVMKKKGFRRAVADVLRRLPRR